MDLPVPFTPLSLSITSTTKFPFLRPDNQLWKMTQWVGVDGEPVVQSESYKGASRHITGVAYNYLQLAWFDVACAHRCRMEILQIMLRCCAHGRSVSRALDKKVSRSGAKRLVGALHSPLLVTELARRWALWKNDIVLRTVRADGDIITILVSASLSLTMSENRYQSNLFFFIIFCNFLAQIPSRGCGAVGEWPLYCVGSWQTSSVDATQWKR